MYSQFGVNVFYIKMFFFHFLSFIFKRVLGKYSMMLTYYKRKPMHSKTDSQSLRHTFVLYYSQQNK